MKGVTIAGRTFGLQLRVQEVRKPTEFEKAFAIMAREGAGAVMVLNDTMFDTHRVRIVELAGKSRLPAMYGLRGLWTPAASCSMEQASLTCTTAPPRTWIKS